MCEKVFGGHYHYFERLPTENDTMIRHHGYVSRLVSSVGLSCWGVLAVVTALNHIASGFA